MSGVAAHSDAIVFIATSSCWLVCSNFAFVERNPDSSAESSWYRCRCCSPEGFEAAWERDPPRSLRGVARCGMRIWRKGEREQEGSVEVRVGMRSRRRCPRKRDKEGQLQGRRGYGT